MTRLENKMEYKDSSVKQSKTFLHDFYAILNNDQKWTQ